MRLNILAIGKMNKGPESEMLDRYVARSQKAGRQLGIDGPYVKQWNESRSDHADKRKSDEAGLLSNGLKPGGVLVALDEHGKDFSSHELSNFIQKQLHHSVPELSFAIGGPDGHGQNLLGSAQLVLRFGRVTWPHQMARVLLAEQIYRSITIISGHPYHRQ